MCVFVLVMCVIIRLLIAIQLLLFNPMIVLCQFDRDGLGRSHELDTGLPPGQQSQGLPARGQCRGQPGQKVSSIVMSCL